GEACRVSQGEEVEIRITKGEKKQENGSGTPAPPATPQTTDVPNVLPTATPLPTQQSDETEQLNDNE
ncbi:MAG: hypothetical protein J1E62_00265, partial [Lachnospiraceae bacterium]|nr:hypothetical protein [Lachnospiraceae bacterium]